MPTGEGLADLLSGSAGAPVNRAQLNSFVANSQARNGLVSAQTQDAMIKAQQAQEELDAHQKLPQALMDANPGMKPSEAALAATFMIGKFGDSQTSLKAIGTGMLGFGTPEEQVSGQQMNQGKVAPLQTVPNNYAVPAGQTPPTVLQSPQGVAQTNATQAVADLNQHKNTDPAAFRAAQFGATSPDGVNALNQAVIEGRLDPARINSRTAPILAQMELQTPGTNFNRLHADAALQGNSTFQQRAMSVDMLPGLLSNVTALGKKLNGGTGYNDLKTVGTMQQWANGQTNDPDYTEYMTARNDTLLRLASVMRGTGMSDQAHTAEIEAMSPTLAPNALDAWLKGQMSVVTPLLERQNRITHLGEKGQGTTPLAPVPPPIGSYPDEASALAAGHKAGDRVVIGGVSGTLQ